MQPLDLLNTAIIEAEIKQSQEWQTLETNFKQTIQQIKPINLLKSRLKEIGNTSNFGDAILSNAVGLATGYLTKNVLIGSTTQPIKKAMGAFLQYQVTAAISKHPETVHALTKGLLSFFKKKETKPPLSEIFAHQNQNHNTPQNES